jgi:hypothetical protein
MLEEQIAQLKAQGRKSNLMIGMMSSSGAVIQAPPVAWVGAILETLTPTQREYVFTKVQHMAIPPVGKHLLMPNGGYPSELIKL